MIADGRIDWWHVVKILVGVGIVSLFLGLPLALGDPSLVWL